MAAGPGRGTVSCSSSCSDSLPPPDCVFDVLPLPKETCRWSTIDAPDRDRPSARNFHSTVVWGDSIYVFGGDDSQGFCGDLHAFDTVSKTWSEVVTVPTADDTGTAAANDADLVEQGEELPAAACVAPRPRRSHTAVEHVDSM